MLTPMIVRFTKMHGAGNDFIVIDACDTAVSLAIEAMGPAGRRQLADRHTGIGCDQLLVLYPPPDDQADVRVRIFNTDGGESAQCGNGMRCIARYLHDAKPDQSIWRLQTDAALMRAQIEADGSVSVEQGVPQIGAEATGCTKTPPLQIGTEQVDFAMVSMGNPHAVLRVDDIVSAPVARLGASLQQYFSAGVNVGFAQVMANNHLALRVWERGVGETLACGSGACAAVVAATNAGMQTGMTTVDLPGGQLMVKWQGNGEPMWLRGPAQRVFEGQTEL